MKRFFISTLVASLFVVMLTSVAGAQNIPTAPYRVQKGDSLAKIARKFCTSWQEIHQFNLGIIGSNPDNLEPGMLIYVVDRCNTGGQGVHDRGPGLHAQGHVIGNNVYVVAPGDTWYSIGQRFGVPVKKLQRYNYTRKLYANSSLTIPGLTGGGGQPQPPVGRPSVRLTTPAAGTVLPRTFMVTGVGQNLFEGNVVIQALDSAGNVLAEKPTVLQGPDVGTGGRGVWSVQLTVNAQLGTPGNIKVFSPGEVTEYSVAVTYGRRNSADRVGYAPGECAITGRPGAPIYTFPGGPQMGQFVAGGVFEARQRIEYNGSDWYMIQPEASAGNPPEWVPVQSLSSIGQGCR